MSLFKKPGKRYFLSNPIGQLVGNISDLLKSDRGSTPHPLVAH